MLRSQDDSDVFLNYRSNTYLVLRRYQPALFYSNI